MNLETGVRQTEPARLKGANRTLKMQLKTLKNYYEQRSAATEEDRLASPEMQRGEAKREISGLRVDLEQNKNSYRRTSITQYETDETRESAKISQLEDQIKILTDENNALRDKIDSLEDANRKLRENSSILVSDLEPGCNTATPNKSTWTVSSTPDMFDLRSPLSSSIQMRCSELEEEIKECLKTNRELTEALKKKHDVPIDRFLLLQKRFTNQIHEHLDTLSHRIEALYTKTRILQPENPRPCVVVSSPRIKEFVDSHQIGISSPTVVERETQRKPAFKVSSPRAVEQDHVAAVSAPAKLPLPEPAFCVFQPIVDAVWSKSRASPPPQLRSLQPEKIPSLVDELVKLNETNQKRKQMSRDVVDLVNRVRRDLASARNCLHADHEKLMRMFD